VSENPDGSEKKAGKPGKPGKGKGFGALALASLVLGILLGSGILVYSSDYYYFGDRTNLTLDIPDMLVSGSRAPFIITTEDRDGNPRSDSSVRITLDRGFGPKNVFDGRTDASGFLKANVDIPDWAGKAVLAVQAGSETVSRLVQIVNASGSPKAKVYLSTDKPIYQPGQTIHIRTLCFGGLDFKASAGPVILQVTDPNTDRIFRKSLTADGYGISSYDFPLSANTS
jgi:uncharacterized protein YfaS (alpha-2-macroglobulin family)